MIGHLYGSETSMILSDTGGAFPYHMCPSVLAPTGPKQIHG